MFSCQAALWLASLLAIGFGISTKVLAGLLRNARYEIASWKRAEEDRLLERAKNKLSRTQRNRGNFLFNQIEEMLENAVYSRFTVSRDLHASGSYEILIKYQGKPVIDAHLSFDAGGKYLSVFGNNNGGVGKPVPDDANDEWCRDIAAWLLQEACDLAYTR